MIVDHITVRETVAFDATAGMRRTRDGYLTATPRVARTGIQVYGGGEVGRPDLAKVRVYRPDSEVFAKPAMESIAHRPVTNDHPEMPITADNWRQHAVGQVDGEVVRDGEFVRVPMAVFDGATIKAIEDGKRELSLGYSADLEWRTGTTDAGEQFDAVQTNIRVNHLAIVDAARGGRKLVIGDVEDAGTSVNSTGVANAKRLIGAGKVNRTAAWAFDASDGNALLGANGDDWTTYGKYHLGIDASATADSKAHWKYPFGKDGQVFRRGVIAAKQRAAQQGEKDVASAADSLLQQIDKIGDRHMSDISLKVVQVDGISVEMSDTAAQVVARRIATLEADAKQFSDKLAAAQTAAVTAKDAATAAAEAAKKLSDTKDAEIVTLKTQLADSKVTPAKLDVMVKDRTIVIGRAKAVIGDELVIKDKTESEMRKQVVAKKLGDACKDWTDDQVRASFDTLTSDVDVTKLEGAADQVARTFGGAPAKGNTVDAAHDAYDKRISNAWKGEVAAKA